MRVANIMKSLSISCVLGLFLVACASTPDVYTQVAPGANLADIKTYGFISEAATDKEGYQSLETNFLKVAVAKEMDARGLRYEPNNPDVIMNFYILTAEKLRTTQSPSMGMGGYYGYRGGYYSGFGPSMGMSYQTTVQQYTEGTLTIDMVDPKQRALLWEGTLKGRVTKTDIRNLEKTIDKAVRDIFSQFPMPDSDTMR